MVTTCKAVNVFGEYNLKNKEARRTKLDFDAPFDLFKKIYSKYPSSFLLESMESDSGLARYSVLGFDPVATLKAHNGILEIKKDNTTDEIETPNPFMEIKSLIGNGSSSKGFQGGLVGYVSYEAVKYFEPVQVQEGTFPDYEFGLFLDAVIFDRLQNKCEYITLGENRVEEIRDLAREEFETEDLTFQEEKHHFSQDKFEKMVLDAKKRIKSGEIFQSVISNAREYQIKGNKLSFYETLRNINPSPYMYHLKLGEREIIGSSPEMLVRVEGRDVETYPIAGTRKRGTTPEKDLKLERELLADEKEKAEHLMLVDLARNDIGKVSEFGTVNVPEYMTVKKFSHVQHIVSRVMGKLQKDKNAVDAFTSIFPAGTVSGAPKIRAMEIINQLEGIPRGPYAGAVGYFSLNGNADFAITIRTLVCQGERGKIQAGAGIVHDSVPTSEYLECENKAQALLSALNMSGEAK
ncbi:MULTISPECIES: anthranilate synthase component I [Methanobacterium]|jgi:anthranilate synthase component 1|uniref:Anthranilate synthase component 1 n=1 Tax=Methanobacterium subterraneum TaxID=59277 RepID=A0A7K4DNS8_9EURY|nr:MULTISPECIES: anthranilate synthase component I [Methanobacterium]AUB58094.1 anthranilate synthase component I [Methanobacterium sp. MZ-A1]MBW4256733.1 anthranilate synthase component I [Methanobacterium sp. YSL]MCC7559212.1 anthranilate synthase component I [Methanobacterium sp.]NMO10121.1 anthranilate synthase component I [Methanobacterium subterraneum]